ncbi:MAG: hypothetical protein H6719_10585 [Sandaracinaceae bacterium]|nr:hypothetical protein [Sandaracinaceae bacterium]
MRGWASASASAYHRAIAGRLGIALLVLLALPARAAAHPTIMPGDVAVVSIHTNPAMGPPTFQLVTLEAFHPVEIVIFTDRGWLASGAFRAGEGEVYWDVDRFVPAGTVVELGGLTLSPGADSVVGFVGALMPDGTPTDSLLFGANLGGAWAADATSDTTSALPPSLAGFEVALGPGLDCAYAGPVVGTRSELLARIGDPDNWTCSDTERLSAPAAFTVYADRGRGCGVDADCGPAAFCAYGVCCDTECRRAEAGHCLTCDFGNGDPRTGTCGPAPTTQLCRTGRGPCDPMDHCDGVDTECPPNAPLGPTDVCRASTGGCDPAEVCDGVSAECPPDARSAVGAVCRPSRGPCDPAEVCADGVVCPDDVVVPDATECDDGLRCTSASSCQAGICSGPVPLECEDGDACTADACSDEGGCTHTPIVGCCVADADCDDGDPCSRDACGVDGWCVATPGLCVDGGVVTTPIDGGPTVEPPPPAGCGCRVGGRGAGGSWLVGWLLLVCWRRRG